MLVGYSTALQHRYRSICANCGGGKQAQSVKDSYYLTLQDNNVKQFTLKHSSYINATTSYLIE